MAVQWYQPLYPAHIQLPLAVTLGLFPNLVAILLELEFQQQIYQSQTQAITASQFPFLLQIHRHRQVNCYLDRVWVLINIFFHQTIGLNLSCKMMETLFFTRLLEVLPHFGLLKQTANKLMVHICKQTVILLYTIV